MDQLALARLLFAADLLLCDVIARRKHYTQMKQFGEECEWKDSVDISHSRKLQIRKHITHNFRNVFIDNVQIR